MPQTREQAVPAQRKPFSPHSGSGIPPVSNGGWRELRGFVGRPQTLPDSWQCPGWGARKVCFLPRLPGWEAGSPRQRGAREGFYDNPAAVVPNYN